ncbi:YgjV family protein [Azospirillum sp. TSO35-2]|uniref:YgjV family protein n=1 Tax=Azospirillum sp. TSO35-2 TaxID=716796 RepID=UPI000D61F610|nr:YgjV family protein [Azospirillum sp. TSO35-2]PWC34277.1 hypothetical protein TSO352_28730 [Azospirillum sp. TSO35-2]
MIEMLTDALPASLFPGFPAGGHPSMAQMIGFCGAAGGMLWPFFRGRVGMLLVQLVPCVCFALHFWLVGAPTGAALNVLAGVQVLAALALGANPAFRIVYLLILPVIAALMAATWTGLPSVFAAAGMALLSLARYQTGVRAFRAVMLLALPCWLVHNMLVGSVPAMLSDMTGIVVNLWILLRSRPLSARPQPVPLAPVQPSPHVAREAKVS